MALAAVLGAGLLSPVAPAGATDGITENALGVYAFRYHDRKESAKWVATVCDDDAPKCIKVTKYEPDDELLEQPGWTGNAYWVVGSWTLTADVPGIKTCDDGTRHTLRTTYSWDAVTNVGWRSFVDPGLCGDDEGIKNRKFELARLAPPNP